MLEIPSKYCMILSLRLQLFASKARQWFLADIFIIFNFSGVVQCLKLSPNLRKQAPEVEAATFLANTKKVFALEQKILSNILEMTKVPEKDARTTHET